MPTYELIFRGHRPLAPAHDVFDCAQDEDAVDLARIRFNLSLESLEGDLLRDGRLIAQFRSDRSTPAPRDLRDLSPASRQSYPARHGERGL